MSDARAHLLSHAAHCSHAETPSQGCSSRNHRTPRTTLVLDAVSAPRDSTPDDSPHTTSLRHHRATRRNLPLAQTWPNRWSSMQERPPRSSPLYLTSQRILPAMAGLFPNSTLSPSYPTSLPISPISEPTAVPTSSAPSSTSWLTSWLSSSSSPSSPPLGNGSGNGFDQDAEQHAMAWVDALKQWEAVRDRPPTDRARRAAVAEFRRLVPDGIPADFRAVVWQKLLSADKLERSGLMESLLQRPPLSIYDQIDKDIGRTYPHHVLFKDPTSPGQVQLASVLKAYAQYNPQVGYTQGMNFITGLLLLHMPPEEALNTLIALMTTHQFPHHSHDLSHMHAACALFDMILAKYLPDLAKYLADNDVQAVMYLPRWWMSGFEVCPWGCRVRIWDWVIVDGFTGFCKASVALLACIQDHILKTHPSEILDVLLHPLSRDLIPDRVAREYAKLGSLDAHLVSKYHAKVEKETGMSAGLPPAPSMASLASSVNLAELAGSLRASGTAGGGGGSGEQLGQDGSAGLAENSGQEVAGASGGAVGVTGLVSRWLGTWSGGASRTASSTELVPDQPSVSPQTS
ncbi:rab-GTPase-TBC domain-domain-containing protein [Catenaria anguillulae PL171]|uniref:Rab-GTPase-TBC domain-domain-containing protein n=1 Tax=Catenaria anguillulae PL171 TaxID=765915 RepID=A0A1Y2HBF6_9FUNG|nr:rab-GTPase-TBC domain-domain-containing protein [Catenaria anguillulae PL171]